MIKRVIIDTGPLVAFLDRDQKHHKWAAEQVKSFEEPLLVCEAVLTETMFLLKKEPAAQLVIFDFLENGALVLNFSLGENTRSVKTLLNKYADAGISLADACIIRMAELNDKHAVFTLDSDFHVYRKHGRQPIQLISPAKR